MDLETYVGMLTIDLERKQVCIAWGKNFEELKMGEDHCFGVSEADRQTEWELEMLLSKAVIQGVKLENNKMKIYLIGIF